MQDLVVDQEALLFLCQNHVGKLMRDLVDVEIKSDIVDGEHHVVVVMRAGGDQKRSEDGKTTATSSQMFTCFSG